MLVRSALLSNMVDQRTRFESQVLILALPFGVTVLTINSHLRSSTYLSANLSTFEALRPSLSPRTYLDTKFTLNIHAKMALSRLPIRAAMRDKTSTSRCSPYDENAQYSNIPWLMTLDAIYRSAIHNPLRYTRLSRLFRDLRRLASSALIYVVSVD